MARRQEPDIEHRRQDRMVQEGMLPTDRILVVSKVGQPFKQKAFQVYLGALDAGRIPQRFFVPPGVFEILIDVLSGFECKSVLAGKIKLWGLVTGR